ncbi:MAG: endonuclease [Modestobacter sp.]|nr:endonuclease [Modestobacter sp.]
MIETTVPLPPSADESVPPDPLAELGDRICAGAVRLAAATAAWLLMVAEFDEREGWHGVGITSCAHWLAWRCALTPGTARQHVRVARAMRRLPAVTAAFTSGELSYSKVRALTRVAEPGTEAELVEFARHATASQVERTVRAWRRSDDVDAGRVADRRRFSWWTDDDGMVTIQIRMEAEPGAQFLASIESLAERDARRERAARKRAAADGTQPAEPEPADGVEPLPVTTERRCRAMTQLAAAAADADRRAGDPPRREVVVVVDAAVLADDEAAGRAHLEGGPALSPAQARRLACDAAVTAIVTDGGQVLAEGRARRYATRAQRRALLVRDGGCARPGCEETRIERLHAHHLRHWLYGGRTDVSNMVLLCDVDHGLAHDEELIMSRRGRELVVHDRRGRRIWAPAEESPLATVTPLRSRGTAAGDLTDLLPADRTLPGALRSDGERMDLQFAVWALIAHREVVRRRAA